MIRDVSMFFSSFSHVHSFYSIVIPENKKIANLVPVQRRWKCDTAWINKANNPDYDRFDQDNVIVNVSV
jgi:hypothetical protein